MFEKFSNSFPIFFGSLKSLRIFLNSALRFESLHWRCTRKMPTRNQQSRLTLANSKNNSRTQCLCSLPRFFFNSSALPFNLKRALQSERGCSCAVWMEVKSEWAESTPTQRNRAETIKDSWRKVRGGEENSPHSEFSCARLLEIDLRLRSRSCVRFSVRFSVRSSALATTSSTLPLCSCVVSSSIACVCALQLSL